MLESMNPKNPCVCVQPWSRIASVGFCHLNPNKIPTIVCFCNLHRCELPHASTSVGAISRTSFGYVAGSPVSNEVGGTLGGTVTHTKLITVMEHVHRMLNNFLVENPDFGHFGQLIWPSPSPPMWSRRCIKGGISTTLAFFLSSQDGQCKELCRAEEEFRCSHLQMTCGSSYSMVY